MAGEDRILLVAVRYTSAIAATGDTLTLPDGTSFLIIESAADSGGERIEFEGTMASPRARAAQALPPDPGRELDGPRAGVVGPTPVHTLHNRSDRVVRFRDVPEPALDFQDCIQALHRQAAAGKMTSRVSPSTLIHGAMVLRKHPTTQKRSGT